MGLDRRHLLLTAAAAALTAARPVRRHAAHAHAPTSSPADAALRRHLDDLAERLLIRWPDQATSLGLDTGSREGLKSQLQDLAASAVTGDHGFCRSELKALDAIPETGLSAAARLDKAVTAYALQLGVDAGQFPYGDNTLFTAMNEGAGPYVVSQQGGSYASVPEFLDSQHKVETADDADAWLSRMYEMSRNLANETARIRQDAALGVTAPDFILDNAIGQQEGLLATPPAQSRLVTALARKCQARHIPGDYAERAADLAQLEVYPALNRQLEMLKEVRRSAGHEAGVWRLPQGEAYYAWLLRDGTTTTLSADEIHRMGLEQNRAIEARMDGLLKAQGLSRGTVGERMAALGRKPEYLFADDDAGRAQLLAYVNQVVAHMRPRLKDAFNLRLKAPLQVKRVPPDIQDGAGLGYMNPGALDGSRPSIYYINLKDTANWPRFSLPTLTYHEGIPGHTWQFAYLAESGRQPLIRLLLSGFNAYVEGWALYSEQLADEMGLYEHDWAGRLGYLQAQKFRAVRLVVDTGLHAKRWSREQAVAWAMQATGRTKASMQSEIDRYCASPGQACGYKVGHSEILRLRDKVKAGLGARYDLRAFDDLVVETGAVPLTVLDQVVEGWIRSRGRPRL